MIRFVSLTFAMLLTPTFANAQAAVSMAAQSESSGGKRIAVNFDGTALYVAVKNIITLSGITLTYSAGTLPATRVTYVASGVTAEQALKAVLEGTGVRVERTSNGTLKLVPSVRSSRSGLAQGVISGKVTDSKNDRGISGASISIGAEARGVVTSDDGSYRIIGVAAGTHTVTVRLVGYAKQTRSVTVGEGATVNVDFKLEPSANVLDQVVVTGTVVASELKSVPNAITVITAKQIEERGITRIDQLFRGDIPGLFALNLGSSSPLDSIMMFSRGATALTYQSAGTDNGTNPIKTYVDGIEMVNASYLSQIDPRSIERIEVLSGPQASTIYGSNALNGVMQIFTKRSSTAKPQLFANLVGGVIQNNFSSSTAPIYNADLRLSGMENRLSYALGGSVNYEGSWTPGKQTARMSGNSGARMAFPVVTADVSFRNGLTRNRERGSAAQASSAGFATGQRFLSSVAGNAPAIGVSAPTSSTLSGQTVGLTVAYTPMSWWSHEVVLGRDAVDIDRLTTAPSYERRIDTTLSIRQSENIKSSEKYTMTAYLPVSSLGALTITAGIDHWRSHAFSVEAFPVALTGTLLDPDVRRDKAGKNSGGFAQGQFNLWDALFLTYGVRLEWNPNYGDEAQPNIAPRYGIAYTKDWGIVTSKLRFAYGRSTRPPTEGYKLAETLNTPKFGIYEQQFANPELGPEFQQGGEGGLELYIGDRASLIVTRYNQTVDALIANIIRIDSVRSLQLDADFDCGSASVDGYCYASQNQYLNVGSIRNQGWELQGNINVGPLSTHGTYSWTKSRIIGITPKYRSILNGEVYQVGRSFNFLPEHTWALTTSYSKAATSVSLTVNGIGQIHKQFDDLYYLVEVSNLRFNQFKLRVSLPGTYRPFGRGYATADINAEYQLTPVMACLIQITNLTDFYQNDFNVSYASAGRQSRIGVRWRL